MIRLSAKDTDIIPMKGIYICTSSSTDSLIVIYFSTSDPDLCNVVRELANCMDKASKGTYLEMLRVVKFVIDTKNLCL
jgi:hypothetical protein